MHLLNPPALAYILSKTKQECTLMRKNYNNKSTFITENGDKENDVDVQYVGSLWIYPASHLCNVYVGCRCEINITLL